MARLRGREKSKESERRKEERLIGMSEEEIDERGEKKE